MKGIEGSIDHCNCEFRCRTKSREVQYSVHRDKRELAIAPVTEAKDVAEDNEFRITKKFRCDRKSVDGLVKDDNGRLLIYYNEQLKRWRKHFT